MTGRSATVTVRVGIWISGNGNYFSGINQKTTEFPVLYFPWCEYTQELSRAIRSYSRIIRAYVACSWSSRSGLYVTERSTKFFFPVKVRSSLTLWLSLNNHRLAVPLRGGFDLLTAGTSGHRRRRRHLSRTCWDHQCRRRPTHRLK